MRIVNNKIYIVKGETPTYSASAIDKDTGAPLIIDKGMYITNDDGELVSTLILEFVVRDSAYSRNDDFKLKYDLFIEQHPGFHLFDDSVIKEYKGVPRFENESIIWDNTWKPESGDENRLHRYTDNDDNFYCVYVDGEWKDYSFDFDITFRYDETSKMEPKTYKYEIALLGGSLKTNPDPKETLVSVVYKKPLLGLTDFIVEGSISE